MNEVKQLKTVQLPTHDGPAYAILLALDIYDPATAPTFLAQALEQFKMQWMIGPPQTTHLLITLVGDLPVAQFIHYWQGHQATDPVLKTIMGLMQVADIRRGSATGELLEEASLLQVD
jgi:hypothetical protein